MGQSSVSAVRFVRRMSGGSQACLVEADDSRRYVVKFRNNPQGRNVLFNDFMATAIQEECGLLVPPCKTIMTSESFFDENRESWLLTCDGTERPEAGLSFASLYMGDVVGRSGLMVLPNRSYSRVHNRASFWLAWLIDIITEQTDRRQVLFLEVLPGRLSAVFLDNGHSFGGPTGAAGRAFASSLYYDYRVYSDISDEQFAKHRSSILRSRMNKLWRLAESLPDEWKSESSMKRFALCLDNLARPGLVASVQEAMVQALSLRRNLQYGQEPEC